MSKKKRKKVENKNIVTNDLDSTEELDVSFIDTKNNKKDEIEEENLEETIDLNGHEVKIRIEKN